MTVMRCCLWFCSSLVVLDFSFPLSDCAAEMDFDEDFKARTTGLVARKKQLLTSGSDWPSSVTVTRESRKVVIRVVTDSQVQPHVSDQHNAAFSAAGT